MPEVRIAETEWYPVYCIAKDGWEGHTLAHLGDATLADIRRVFKEFDEVQGRLKLLVEASVKAAKHFRGTGCRAVPGLPDMAVEAIDEDDTPVEEEDDIPVAVPVRRFAVSVASINRNVVGDRIRNGSDLRFVEGVNADEVLGRTVRELELAYPAADGWQHGIKVEEVP
jgi:hypothetical protein